MKKSVLLVVLLLSSVAAAENGARYLVIAADALYNSVLPLAQWKHAAGISTRVVKLSQVGSDTASIKNYIKNAWNNWPVQPEYVLIVGAPNLVPARYHNVQGGWSYYSDNVYADMAGDLEAELAVGRLPARSAAQLDLMVAKTLSYERTPDLADSLWMRRLTTVIREGGDSDDTIYWSNIRHAARQAGSAGFVKCDSFSYYRGHNSNSIINSVSGGTGLLLYRGTAGGNWYQPFEVNPALTNNGRKLPIVLSITCETMTLAPYESMVGEAWVKAGTVSSFRGAVAFFGNTHSAMNVARLRGAVCRGFFDGLFNENTYRLGYTAMRARRQLRTEFPTYTSDYRGFNLLGDPALPIWTGTPRRLDVIHPASIEPGAQRLHLTVMRSGNPVNSALVCASMPTDTTVYSYGLTNFDGEVSLDIAPGDTGHLRIVVTGQNLLPYDTLIPVHYTAVAEPGLPRPGGTVSLKVTPSFFRDRLRVDFSAPDRATPRLVIRDALGRCVSSWTLGVGSSSLRLDLRTMPAGVYLCVLEDATRQALATRRLVKIQ